MVARSDLAGLIRALEDAASQGLDRTMAFLASPSGRRLRTLTAQSLLLATPVILRHPFFRTPLGRLVRVGGGAALVAKAAATLREWEPSPAATRIHA